MSENTPSPQEPSKEQPAPEISETKDQTPEEGLQVEISNSLKDIVYSKTLNTFYTGLDKPCTFEIAIKSELKEPLVARIMLISEKRPTEPLIRCHHHLKNDYSETRHHVVIRLDGKAQYVGTPQGREIKERLGMLVEIATNDRKSMTFEFKCLSSCYSISKPATALAFYFEDAVSGVELGRIMIPIHISKNFERDMRAAEHAMMNRSNYRKRKPQTDLFYPTEIPIPVVPEKVMLADSSSVVQPKVEIPTEEPNKLHFSIELPPERCEVFKNILQSVANVLAATLYEAEEAEQDDLKPLHGEVKRKLDSLADWTSLAIKKDSS